MDQMVGSALLSGLFNVLFERLATEEVKNFLRPKTVINKLLKKLEVLLLSANKLLADAEEKQIKDDLVKKWHNELKDVVCKADELADKIETEVLRLKMEENQSASESSFYEDLTDMFTTLWSNPLSSFDNYVKDELEEILPSLEHLLSQKDALGLEPAGKSNYSGVKTRVSERSRPTPVADESDFCGREEIKETIIQSLRTAGVGGDKVSVIPVRGAGGLGKTTLVQIIYDLPEVEQLFGKVRAWVTVSTEFDLPTMTKTIIEKIAHPSPIMGNEDQHELLFKLRDVLKGKKFLLVLDDVWSEDRGKWNTLKSCFKSAESGSKIIVTTRSAKVASIMAPNQQHHFLQELPDKDCLVLFAQTVFGDDEDPEAYSDLQEIGEKIVRKCKGNPLSVVTVGGILCGERRREKWEKILESSLWELLQKDNQDIIPSLWLSYLYLPSEIKPCFAYCSIFPKDYLFRKEEVVQLWMAEGFLQNEAGKRGITMEEVGKRYFEELISRSLFQSSKTWFGDQYFIMHDLVHDLAMNVSGEFCFCLEGENNLLDLSCKTRYLSYNMAIQDVKNSEGLSKAKRLHSFVGLRRSTQTGVILKVLEELATEGGCLRVLSLPSDYAMKSLPDSIGDLRHLRYLNLSRTGLEKLPDSVGTLYNLQTLLLSYCKNLTQLPDSIGNLKHLRDLNLSHTAVEKLPDSVGTLYNLQTLLLSNCEGLTQLPDSIGNLKHLRDLNLSCTAVEKLPDSVGTLYDLQTLLLSDCSKLTQLPDSIGNLKHLRDLDLSDSAVEKLPDSVGTLYDLQTLILSRCSKLAQLPNSIGNLKHLRELNLSGSAVEKLPDSVGTLYDLQTLLLSNCSKLTQLPDSIGNLKHLRDLNLSGSAVEKLPDSVGTLYDLQTLLLSGCSKLTQLPDSIGNLKHLKDLNLSRTWLNKLPDSVGTLYNLQNLRLSKCYKLTQLPSNLGRLTNLRHLDTRKMPLEEMPPDMCNLTKLQTLSDFVVGKRGSSIKDLGALHDLNGELRISGLQNVDDVLKGNLEDKENLSKLVLQWKGQTDDSIKDRTVLDALKPHADLKELSISGYGGTSFPVWVLSSKIERMHLDGCQDCLFLPSLGKLPSLKELKIRGFHKLETIDDEFYGNDSPFKSLEVLHFSDMPEWKRWSVIEVPRLQKLKLKGCPKLVGGLPNCKTLTTLVIDSCPKLEYSGNQCCYPSLESLKIRESCCYIRRLSLEHLTKLNKLVLTELDWLVELTGESSNEVKSLFIEKCPKLEFLGNSRYGSLENLKIEQCEALNSIPLDYFPKLNELTLRYCQNFESFRFGEEPPLVLESLSFLKLKGLPKFVSFPEGGLPAPNLKDFYIKECENLRALPQQMHRLLPSLKSLTVKYCGKIKWWPDGGVPSNLESLRIWRCKKLAAQVMHWDLQLTCLKSFWIDGCGEELLDSFPPEGLLPTSLTALGIEGFPHLKTLNIHAFQHLKKLSVYICDELPCLPEESLPNSLSYLDIEGCPLLERRYRKETGEGWHKISHIPRVYINEDLYINEEEQH